MRMAAAKQVVGEHKARSGCSHAAVHMTGFRYPVEGARRVCAILAVAPALCLSSGVHVAFTRQQVNQPNRIRLTRATT